MEMNTYVGDTGEAIGQLLNDMRRRIERLEQQDKLTRKHPTSPDASPDFAGTVFRTPDGTPVFIASQRDGLELPGVTPSERALVEFGATSKQHVVTAGNTSTLWRWTVPHTLTTGFLVGLSIGAVVASGTFQLSSYSGFPPLGTFVASSDAVPVNITDASTSRLQFAWEHQVPVSAVTPSYIELSVTATSGDLVVGEPAFGFLMGASTLGATQAGSVFLGHAA